MSAVQVTPSRVARLFMELRTRHAPVPQESIIRPVRPITEAFSVSPVWVIGSDLSDPVNFRLNLINNAINYTGKDKTVWVRQKISGDKVRIEVTDSGDGIAKEALPYVWDRYYKVDKTHKRAVMGTGLGLSIVKNILELHHAGYGVVSEPGWFPSVFGNMYGLNVIVVLVITLGMYVYMKYSKQGYEIAVVGESQNTARYAGINVKKVIIRTMMISGAICGLSGCLIVSGASHTISTSTAGGRGFTAIIVAWMSKFNPFAMILVSAFLVFMQQGSIQIASQFGLNENASDIITGILLFFLIGCEFFINYRLEWKKNHKEGK